MRFDTTMSPIFVFNKMEGRLPEINNDKLAQEILAHQERKVSDPKASMYEDMVLLTPEGSEAKKLIASMTALGESIGYCMADYWQHTHHKFESSDTHIHKCAYRDIEMSWCYYVKAPKNCGDLVFISDVVDERAPAATVTPKEGHFVVFPSFLKHRVGKNMSDDLRISVAGDFIPFGARGAYK